MAAQDNYSFGLAVVPDTAYASGAADAIYVGGAGNINVQQPNGVALLYTAVPVGTILPVRSSMVVAASTTATLLIALYG
jgi:hypothetical protein